MLFVFVSIRELRSNCFERMKKGRIVIGTVLCNCVIWIGIVIFLFSYLFPSFCNNHRQYSSILLHSSDNNGRLRKQRVKFEILHYLTSLERTQ